MIDGHKCTECGLLNTERVHTDFYGDGVDEIRICNDCQTEYVNQYNICDRWTNLTEENND